MGRRAGWGDVYDALSARDPAELTADERDLLADALFWLDRPQESASTRQEAYTAHVAAARTDKAALAAWRLFYDHFLVGETAIAGGWLERARSHVTAGDAIEAGWVAIADADCHLSAGDATAGLHDAQQALAIGRRAVDCDLVAMALQAEGRALCELGRSQEGVARFDEAMVSVVSGELDPLFTGWVFCNVLSTCHGLADLGRAAQWSDEAMRWCDTLREGLMYPGLCRIYAVELACLRGAWAAAAADARLACNELTAHDPRYAGEAFYLVGELCRLTGDLDGAQEAYTQAHQLGRSPQPGLAQVRLTQGRHAAAVNALRLALRPGPTAPLPRTQLLAALVEAELRNGDTAAARNAADELSTIADRSHSPYLGAVATVADGSVLLAVGDPLGALPRLRDACSSFRVLGMPYEAAQAQTMIGIATRLVGDEDTAVLELAASLASLERLGARLDAERVRRLLAEDRPPDSPLTAREIEVLRLVARGGTNKEVGKALFLSEHTVARHLSNAFTKIGVTSRAAATAYAYEHRLIPREDDGRS